MMNRATQPGLTHLLTLLIAIGAATPALAENPIEAEQLYDVPRAAREVREEVYPLLRKVADRPDIESRLQTLRAIARFEMKMLAPTVEKLAEDDRTLVRAAVARTAIAVEAKQLAPMFIGWLKSVDTDTPKDHDLVIAADRALAEWASTEAIGAWSKRVADPTARPALRASAADSLGKVFAATPDSATSTAGTAATEALTQVIDASIKGQPDVTTPVLFAAAGAIGSVDPVAGAAQAKRLSAGDRAQRIAAGFAARGEQAAPTLKQLALDSDHAVAATALRQIIALDKPVAVTPELLTHGSKRDNYTATRLTYELAGKHQMPNSITVLITGLGNLHPDNREQVRQSMLIIARRLDTPVPDPLVIQHARALDAVAQAEQTRRWREAEQLALLFGQLDHEPSVDLLTRWLNYPHDRVRAGAMRVIRRFDAPGARLPALAIASGMIDKYDVGAHVLMHDDRRSLFNETLMTLGVWREARADKPLRKLVPKQPHIESTFRASAIWSLGMIHETQPPADLCHQLIARMIDLNPLNPEHDEVRLQSAIALGRMRFKGAQAELKKRYDSFDEIPEIRAAARWALGRITGKLPPAIELPPAYIAPDFLRPVIRR